MHRPTWPMHTTSHLCVQGPDSQHTSTQRLPTTPDNARLWRDGTQGGLMLVSSVQGQRLTRPPRLMCHRLSNINSKFSQNDNKAAIQKLSLSKSTKAQRDTPYWCCLHIWLLQVHVYNSWWDFLRRKHILTNQCSTVIIFVLLVIGFLLPQPESKLIQIQRQTLYM